MKIAKTEPVKQREWEQLLYLYPCTEENYRHHITTEYKGERYNLVYYTSGGWEDVCDRIYLTDKIVERYGLDLERLIQRAIKNGVAVN